MSLPITAFSCFRLSRLRRQCAKSVPLSKEFLSLHFWRAIQGIDPRDTATPADKFKRKKVRIIYPEQIWAESAKDKNTLLKETDLVNWIPPKEGKEQDDQRWGLLHHHDAKSGRMSTAEVSRRFLPPLLALPADSR